MELISKTQLEQDLDTILRNIETIGLAVSSTVQTLNNAHSAFWNLPDERLINVLNLLGPEKVQEMFTRHFEIATAANAFLDAAEFNAPRAIVERGREINLGEDGLFSIIPAPVQPPVE